MAYNSPPSLLAILFVFNILLATTGQAFAGRDIPTNSNNNVDKKQPEFLFKSDGLFIPGVGWVSGWPTGGGVGGFGNLGGGGGSTGSYVPGGGGGSTGSYVPGGDDTFVPSPGVEVPNP